MNAPEIDRTEDAAPLPTPPCAVEDAQAATMVLPLAFALPPVDEPRPDVLMAERDALARGLAQAEQAREDMVSRLATRDFEVSNLNRALADSRAASTALVTQITGLRAALVSAQTQLGRERDAHVAVAVGVEHDGSVDARPARELRETRSRARRYLEALETKEWWNGAQAESARLLELERDKARSDLDKLADEQLALAAELEKLRGPHAAAPDAATRPVAGTPVSGTSLVLVERSAHANIEREAETLRRNSEQQLARIAELETFGVSLGRALQGQSDATHASTAKLGALEAANQTLKIRVHQLEEEIAAVRRRTEEHTRAARFADVALAERNSQLAEAMLELQRAEREGRARAEANTRTTAELEVLRAAHNELGLMLEHARGALDERNLQIRRLERATARQASPPSREEPVNGGLLQPVDGTLPKALRFGRRTTVGRAAENDICIDHASVSRHHAVLIAGPTGTFIEDLKSANGVGVNGRRVRHARLADGDLVAFGSVRFRFAARQQEPAAGATPAP